MPKALPAKTITDLAFAKIRYERAEHRLAESFADLNHQLRLFGGAVMIANAMSGGTLFQGEQD